jgi:hypothetical protein
MEDRTSCGWPRDLRAPRKARAKPLALRRSLADRRRAGATCAPSSRGRKIVATTIGPNIAKQKLAANELVLCLGVNQLRTPNIAMIAAACGFDAIYIDLEHNPTSLETAASVCAAALTLPGPRIPVCPVPRIN